MYTLGQDDILGTVPPRQNPEVVEAHRKDCQDFFRRAYNAVCVILSALDKQLALPLGTLASLCPLDKPSATSLRMLLTGAQSVDENHRITLPGHTDIGAITLLFNVTGGLQILPSSSENASSNWRYIRPEPGCALINIGDTLVEWTGGVLRSSLHRVVTAPGKQAGVARQSLAYLVRPDHNGSMRRLRSKAIPPVVEDEVDETRSVNDWAAWRAFQIMKGELKAQTRGGRPVQINNAVKVN
jgi:isopenicillin N synthase-like dioxygenase